MNSDLATCGLLWKAWSERAFVGSHRHAMSAHPFGEPDTFSRGSFADGPSGETPIPLTLECRPTGCDHGHLTALAGLGRIEARMAKKAIAVMLLVAMAAWAEMALAPMLAMHAGHMRPGHEMVFDMPAHHRHLAEHQQARAEGLPCCPAFHKAQHEAALMVSSGAPACDDPHSCCFRQGPQSVPAPVRDAQKLTRDISPAVLAELPPARETARIPLHDSALELSPPAGVFGMILRI